MMGRTLMPVSLNTLALCSAFALLASCGSSGSARLSDAGPPPPDAAPPPDLCRLTPAVPQWVVEGETLSFTVACESGVDLDDAAISNVPAGASFDSASNTFQWTPGLGQAAVYELELQAPSLNAVGSVTVGVADAYDDPNNEPIADLSTYTMELGLPVFFLSVEPSSEDDFAPTTVTYGGVVHSAEAKLRGKSSISYPKKSYALRFDKFDAFNETQFANFGNRTRVILTSTFDDNAYFRQRMAYDLWNRLDPSIQVEAYNAVVYIGTEYWGLYTVSDHINEALMRRSGLPGDGNLYKAENHDANFRLTRNNGNQKSTLSQGYSKVEGDPKEGEAGAFDDLEELVNFVATAEDAAFDAEIEDRIDVDDYVAWWLLATFTIASDSAGKNSYHHHNATGPWRVVPWDFNHSFGQTWETEREIPEADDVYYNRNEIFARLAAHPTIGPARLQRFQSALNTGAFEKLALQKLIDGYIAEIDLSARRDWEKWQGAYRSFSRWSGRNDFTSYEEEVQYVRDWLNARWQYAHDTFAPL